ncbi:MAG: hypothetical protein IJS26_02860 [Alphaproteobacteria bacterium]|nr:hypothetical protein [Alphaproteobacteria bacterium]
MKKITYVVVFCLGVVVMCIYSHISLIKSAAAENPGKQKLLNQMAYRLASQCATYLDIKNGTACADYYQYYQKLGGTNELIYSAQENGWEK